MTLIRVFSDLDAISHEAASLFIKLAKESVKAQTRFVAALSGGSTPRRLYSLLGSLPYRDQVDWPRVHIFWVDERCVPKDHEESNFKVVFDRLLSKVPIPGTNIHRIKGEELSEHGARDYEAHLKEFFGLKDFPIFDLVLLGMGEDGHTASLFPGSKWLNDTKRLVIPVHLKNPNLDRVTLTLPVLNHARNILFLVTGHSKAKVLAEVMTVKSHRHPYPAARIHPIHGRLLWFIDPESSSKLRSDNWGMGRGEPHQSTA